MAEAWARYFGGNEVLVDSAGTNPAGLNPNAVWAMHETGIDISHQTSDHLSEKRLSDFDWVITLCGGARESCPPLPHGVKSEHWNLPDPASVHGQPKEVLQAFRIIRYQIERRVKEFLQQNVS